MVRQSKALPKRNDKIQLGAFDLISDFKPSGDQGYAISKLTDGLNSGLSKQTLLGVKKPFLFCVKKHLS